MIQLRGLLSLPASRKVFLALVFAALVAANRRFALGLELGDLAVVAGVLVCVVLGIAGEDAARVLAEARRSPPPERKP